MIASIKATIVLIFLSVGHLIASEASYTHQLDSAHLFTRYAKRIDTSHFIKFVLDLETDIIYYFNVNTYEMHVDFVFDVLLKIPSSRQKEIEFLKNYLNPSRRFLLCYLVHHESLDIWSFAFWEGDTATGAHINKAYEKLKKTFYCGHKVYYRPCSTAQEHIATSLVNIPIITNDSLYRLDDYQLLSIGKAVGKLRIVTEVNEDFSLDDIVILSVLLPDITPVKGIITEQFSTPLSHLALRARAWHIPHMGLKEAKNKYQVYEGQYVFFETSAQGYELRLATAQEIATSTEHKPNQTYSLSVDLTKSLVKSLAEITVDELDAYGAKAANLAHLSQHIQNLFSVPSGYVIPMHYYNAHLKESGLQAKLQEFLQQKQFKTDRFYRKTILRQLQQELRLHPLNPILLEEVWQKLEQNTIKSVFVRSSTNAEGLPGYSGAGLYDTVPNVTNKNDLEKAIKSVWASLWSDKAYQEREFFGIDHQSVYAAVMIQESKKATSSGVMITKNIFDPLESLEVYTINAKHGQGVAVVDGLTIPEQLLFTYDTGGIKVVSRSHDETITVLDENGGIKQVPNPYYKSPVLTNKQAIKLAESARFIKACFTHHVALDIEWLFENGKLFIVQTRPYQTK